MGFLTDGWDECKKAEDRLQHKPVGWVYKKIVNKHVSGPPLEGQIQMHGVWGTKSDYVYFSVEQPTDPWIYWQKQVYFIED